MHPGMNRLIGVNDRENIWSHKNKKALTPSRRRPLSYRHQSINLRSKSMDWFLYDNGLRHERVRSILSSKNIFDRK